MKSKLITVSAVSSALVAVCLTIGAYFDVADLIALVLASAFVILPLYYKSKTACFLSYLSGGIIAVILSGFNFTYSIVFPAYFVFFGVFPIVRNIMADKNVNKVLTLVLGLVWCVATFFGMYFYYTAVMSLDFSTMPAWVPQWVSESIIYFVGVIGVVFYFIFDRYVLVVRIFFDRYLNRIIK